MAVGLMKCSSAQMLAGTRPSRSFAPAQRLYAPKRSIVVRYRENEKVRVLSVNSLQFQPILCMMLQHSCSSTLTCMAHTCQLCHTSTPSARLL
jgi:hypothetical protein